MTSTRRKVHTTIDWIDTGFLFLFGIGALFLVVMVCYSLYLVFWY